MVYWSLAVIYLIGIAIKNKFVLSTASYSDEHMSNINIKRERKWVFFFLVICALVMGLRDSAVGEDTQRYMTYFDYISSFPLSSVTVAAANTGLDIGYAVLMKLISLVCNNYFFFQFVISMFICVGYAYFLLENRIDTSVGIAVFLGGGLYFSAFNTTRQSCALTLLLIAWTLLQKKEHIKVIILVMVAMTMHLSAVIFVIPIVIYIFRKHRFIHWIVIGGVLFVTLFYNQMLKLMSSIFPRYSHITANDNQYMNAGFSAIVWIIVFVISIMILKKNKKYQLKESIFAVCAIFYPLFSCLGLAVNYFERLGFYFIPFVPVVLDSFGKKEFTSNRILYRAVVCLFFGVWFLIACKNYPYEITNLFGGV